jgi:hypothetical protein
MLKVNIPMLKHHLFAAFQALPAAAIIALLSLVLAACSKDDPEPGPSLPPDPPSPVEPGTVQRVALRLQARPAGDNPEPWSPTDTLHLVLAEPAGRTALGDTALFRYVFPEKADATDKATYFIPASEADSAFLPSDSSLVDLMAYRPASPALQLDRLLLSVDTREHTATGRPLMTAERTVGLHAGQPEANIVLSHRLTRLYVNLNMIDSTGAATATGKKAVSNETATASITLHGNPAQAVWSLPDEKFIEYGDTLPQPFAMQHDGLGGYLYTLPGIEGKTSSLTLTIEIPDRVPLNISLNEYLPEGLLQAGISVDIRIDVPKNPDPGIDPEPEPTPDPDPSPEPDPDPSPDPTPPDPNILRIQVTQSDWENIIYDIMLDPDGED